MTYLPAPYESAQQDDLPAALSAGLTISLAAITSWVTGSFAYDNLSPVFNGSVDFEDLPTAMSVPTIGWSIGVLFMVIGMLTLGFRRGRQAIMLGALISLATTLVAQFIYGYPDDPALGAPIEQWPLYWGGLAVVVVASLPATKRWIVRKTPLPPPAGGPTLWPGT